MIIIKQLMVLLAIFALAWSPIYAQTETIKELDSVAAETYWYQPGYVMMHDMAVRNRVWLPNETKNKASILGVSQVYSKGEFQPAQGVAKMSQYGVYTEGKTKWKNTNFWGRFSYYRSSEDSTAMRHQTRWNADAPFYFGSLRKNKYNRETYKLDAGIQRAFLNNHLPISLAVDYRLGSHYSNNDPRGNLNDMNLQFEMTVGHNLPKLSYHISGIWGYGSERAEVGYKNDKYTMNTDDPLYVNWAMNGFGNAEEQLKEINYFDVVNRYGAGFHILLKPNTKNKIYFNGRYVNEKQSFRKNDNSVQTYQLLNDYAKDIGEVEFLWSSQFDAQRSMKWLIMAKTESGDDFNYNYMANNYVYQKDQAMLKGQYSFMSLQLEGNLCWSNMKKKDGATDNVMDVTQLNSGIALYRTFKITDQFDLLGKLGYQRKWSPQHELQVPVLNSGDFAKQILYQDYLYETASSNIWSTAWVWMSRRPHNNWSVQLQVDYQRGSELAPVDFSVRKVMGKDWYNARLGISYLF